MRSFSLFALLLVAACREAAPPSTFSAPVEVTIESSAAAPGFKLFFSTSGTTPEAVVPAVTAAVAMATRKCPGLLQQQGGEGLQVEWRAGVPAVVTLPIGATGECVASVLKDPKHAEAAKLNVRALIRALPALDAGTP